MSIPELLTPIRLKNQIICPPAPARRFYLDENESDEDYSDMPGLIPIESSVEPPVEQTKGMRITPQSWTDKCNDQCNDRCAAPSPTEILEEEEEVEEEEEAEEVEEEEVFEEEEEVEVDTPVSCNRLMNTDVSVVLPAWAWMSVGFLIAGIVLYKI
jgi:hypothetical protein